MARRFIAGDVVLPLLLALRLGAPAWAGSPLALACGHDTLDFQSTAWKTLPAVAHPAHADVQAFTTPDAIQVRFTLHAPMPGDSVTLSVDPYRDGRGEYRFTVTREGIESATCTFDHGWSGAWEAHVQAASDTWQCLITVPFDSLRYPKAGKVQWGLGFGRRTPAPALAAVALTVPPMHPVLVHSKNETTATDSDTVSCSLTPNLGMQLVLPDGENARPQLAAAPGELTSMFGQYRPFFQQGHTYVTTPFLNPAFQDTLSLLTGEVVASFSFQRNHDEAAGSGVSVNWSRPYGDRRVSLVASWMALHDAGGDSQSRKLTGTVRLNRHLELGSSLSEQDTARFHDGQLGATLTLNPQSPTHLNLSWSGGTWQGQPDSKAIVSGVVGAGPRTQLDVSYVTRDSLPFSTPIHVRSWRGSLRYQLSRSRAVTCGVRQDEQGGCTLYGSFRRQIWDSQDMILTLGDPGTSGYHPEVFLKIVDRL